MLRKSQRSRTDGAQRDDASHRARVSPQHTPPPASLSICRPLHSTSENDGGVHQEANLILTVTQKRSVLEWSPLNSVAFLFFLPSRRDGRTLCFRSSFGDFSVQFHQG